jgi:hypothetical protein
MQNRNLLHKGMGYFYCLDHLQKMRPNYLLINQHVVEPFRYSQEQIRHMIAKLQKRKRILAELFPWDPYGQQIKPGQKAEITVKIFNHSNSSHTFTVSLNVPEEFRLKPEKASINIKSGKEREARFKIVVPNSISEKVYVITSDIKFDKWDLRHWSEAILEVQAE